MPETANERSASWAGSIVPLAVTVWRTVPFDAATSVVVLVVDADERVVAQTETPMMAASSTTRGAST